jgi:lactoylglutathione lyase
MKYLHTMIRVTNLETSLRFYCEGLGFKVISRNDYPDGKFTLVFLCAPGDDPTRKSPQIELTHNWETSSYERGNAYGHTAYAVDSIEKVRERLKKHGYDLSWGPGDSPSGKTKIAFIDDPDGYEIELIQH